MLSLLNELSTGCPRQGGNKGRCQIVLLKNQKLKVHTIGHRINKSKFKEKGSENASIILCKLPVVSEFVSRQSEFRSCL